MQKTISIDFNVYLVHGKEKSAGIFDTISKRFGIKAL